VLPCGLCKAGPPLSEEGGRRDYVDALPTSRRRRAKRVPEQYSVRPRKRVPKSREVPLALDIPNEMPGAVHEITC